VPTASAGPGGARRCATHRPLSPAGVEGQDAGGAPGGSGGGPAVRRVLIVDDNVDVAKSFALLLNALGHEVRAVHDGEAALEVAPVWKPDVVFLDIGLPGLSGYDVARRMRELAPLRHVLLIAVTGYGEPNDQLRSQEAGFDHHLLKPVDIQDVERLLAR
jgi:CheY-like chemotaxis protein